jgi:hypothetical protein
VTRHIVSGATALVVGLAAATAVHANNVDGAWISPTADNWPLIPIHAVLTPDGRVLSYGTDGTGRQTAYFIYDVWDPAGGLDYNPSQGKQAGHVTLDNITLTDIFCSSQIILPQSGNISSPAATTGPVPAPRIPAMTTRTSSTLSMTA